MQKNPDNHPQTRCIRCGRPIRQGAIGPACRKIKNWEILTEARALGYDGKMMKDGVQLLIAFD